VPFRGAEPATIATMANQVQLSMGGAATAGPHITAGKLRAIATGRAERLGAFPDVPTLKEEGFENIDPHTWFGVFAPAATPPAVVAKIQRDISAIINSSEFKQRFVELFGYTPVGSTPQAFASFINEDLARKKEMITIAGIKAE